MNHRTSSTAPAWTTILDPLRWRAEHQADRDVYTFLIDGEEEAVSLTFADLERRARALAAHIQSVVPAGTHVLLLLPPGIEYPIGVYGTLMAGAVLVPSAPPRSGQGVQPIESAVMATRSTAVLTTVAVRATLEEDIARSAVLNQLTWLVTDDIPPGAEYGWVDRDIRPDALAMLWLTSGSTGLPKGTMRSHASVVQVMAPALPIMSYTEASRIVSFSPPNFAMSLALDTFAPVIVGASATLMPTGAILERPARWLETITRVRGTHSAAPNFAYDLCVNAISPQEREALDLRSWKAALSGGEMLRAHTIEGFTATFAECGFEPAAFGAAYGMTEAGVISLHPLVRPPLVRTFDRSSMEHRRVVAVDADDANAQPLVSVGPPAEGIRCEIVDPETRMRSASDAVGEIWVSSPSVADGYFDRPEATEETFSGYLADTGEGPFLRTGDLGFVHDGDLYVSGRVKELVIIRGRNISPQAIERAAEQSHPALVPGGGAAFSVDIEAEERLVVVHEVDAKEEDLVSVVAAIRQAVAAHIEIQAYDVVLIEPGTLPRATGGKIQRRPCRIAYLESRLHPLHRSIVGTPMPSADGMSLVAPGTAAEEAIASTWREILRLPAVSVTDNFFALGGDSLLSMQMISRLRQAGWQVDVEHLLQRPTIEGLASIIQQKAAPSTDQGPVAGVVPLTPRQYRYFERIHPDDYNAAEVMRLATRQPLDAHLLEQVVAGLVMHHDALRMRFHRVASGWSQEALPAEDKPVFTYFDASGLPEKEQYQAISNAAADLKYGLNIEDGPIMRVALVHTDAGMPDTVLWCVNHLVFDAFSMRILMEDLERGYRQVSRGEDLRFPPKTTSYKEWSERLQAYAGSPEADAELGYWLDDARATAAQLPVDSEVPGYAGTHASTLSAEETEILLRDVARRYGTEVNDVLLTALMRAFEPWTGSRQLLIELVSHGRGAMFPDIDLSRTVGYLASHFPVLLQLGPASGIAEELQTIRDQLREIPHGGVGYGVWRYLGRSAEVTARLQELPEPQVMFKYDGQFDQTFPVDSLFVNPFASGGFKVNPHDVGAHHLMVNPMVIQNQLCVVVRSGVMVHERATLEAITEAYVEALRAIIATCRPAVAASGATPSGG